MRWASHRKILFLTRTSLLLRPELMSTITTHWISLMQWRTLSVSCRMR
ncbi:Uncharacterised protein [Vibrio cholerae]|nr:Uncharacterised protein [Vibrio cholerae]